MMDRDIRSHKRINDILLGPLERPALHWLAAHLPAWVTPDLMTVLGVFGAIIIFTGYWLTVLDRNYIWLASFGFIVNWFGDSLDGTLARYRNIERPYFGFYIDHSIDVLTQAFIFLGLGSSVYVRFDIACLALIGYLMLSNLVYIQTCVVGEFRISYGKLGPTEARLIAITANTLIYFIGNPKLNLMRLEFSLYDWIALAIIFLLMIMYFFSLISNARSLSRIDSSNKRH